jgi:hypothetical protein
MTFFFPFYLFIFSLLVWFVDLDFNFIFIFFFRFLHQTKDTYLFFFFLVSQNSSELVHVLRGPKWHDFARGLWDQWDRRRGEVVVWWYAAEGSSIAMACGTFERFDDAATTLVVNDVFGLLGSRMVCLGIDWNTGFVWGRGKEWC